MEERNFTFKSCFVGALFSAVVLIVMTLLLSVVAKMTTVGENIIKIGSYIISAFAGLCGGIASGKGAQRRGVICGTAVGVILIVFIKILELISTGSVSFNDGFYISSLCMFVASVLGGIVGVN